MIRKRLVAAMSGNVANQAVNAIIQIAGIPFLLTFWGVNYYGEWLIIFTIPSYIGMSDMGLGSSTSAELSMLVEAKRHEEAKEILRNTFWFVLIIGGIPFLLLGLSIFLLPWYQWLNLEAIPEGEFNMAFFLLILYVYLALFLTIPLGYYRVQKIYHWERFLSALFRIIEFGLVILAIVIGYKIVVVALIYFLVRLIQLIFVLFDLTRKFSVFRLFPFGFKYSKVKKLMKPGLSTMAIYMGNNFMNQGLISIIGIGLGSVSVVLFSTIRTLVNMVKQAASIINSSVMPEISYAYGAENYSLLRKLFRVSVRITSGLSMLLLSGLFFIGGWILQIWTGDKVHIVEPFFTFMLIATFFHTIWNLRLILMISTNKMGTTGLFYLGFATTLIAVNAVGVSSWGISGVGFSIILFELALLLVVTIASNKVLHPDKAKTVFSL